MASIVLSNVPGYFLQDDANTNALRFDYTSTDFGLKKIKYDSPADAPKYPKSTQWQRFENELTRLNGLGEGSYKTLFLARHGQGFHNVKEARSGTLEWQSHWAHLDGDGSTRWDDALLTELGTAQAGRAHQFWADQMRLQHMLPPQKYYTSPHRRCLQTARITFGGLSLPADRPFVPEIRGALRETYGIHTCDRLSNREVIRAMEPEWKIADDVTEKDELWAPDWRENEIAITLRFKKALEKLWAEDSCTSISLTLHSGAIAAILRVIGHRPFPLITGEVIPVLVRGVTQTV